MEIKCCKSASYNYLRALMYLFSDEMVGDVTCLQIDDEAQTITAGA